MPNVTPNYGLKKPLPEEFYDIGVHNENMDIIDDKLGKALPSTGGTMTGPLYIEKDGERKGWIEPVTGEHELNVIATNDSKNIIRYLNINAGEDIPIKDRIKFVDNSTLYCLYGEHNSPVKVFTATVGTNWTADGDFFYQDIAVEGILDTDIPDVDVLSGADNTANVTYCETFCKIFRVTTLDGSIRVWATEAVTTAFPIQLRVVR